MMWKLKSCPRCGGDVFVDRDVYEGWYEQCLQCGYRAALRNIADAKEEIGNGKLKQDGKKLPLN